jgi:DNA-binding MarR family transcriptional regulator
MKERAELGDLLEAFVNRVSHPRGRALTFLAKAGVTVDQAILLSFALQHPGSTPSSLAAMMNLSLPSVSQMIERLVKLGLLRRREDPEDRRCKVIEATAKAKTFLARLREVRSAELAAGTAALSPRTRRALFEAIAEALKELSVPAPSADHR